MSRRLTTEEFIYRSTIKHNSKYLYPNTKYIRSSDKVKIECRTHGEFEQRASNHLRGLGCHICSSTSNLGMVKPWSDRLLEIKNIHGNKYSYKNNEDVGAFDFIEITCKEHGLFKQRLHDHLAGKGCRACGNGSNYRKSEYINKCNRNHNGFSNFYVLEITEVNGDIFYKIGITVQDIPRRYSKSVMPYKYKVLKNIKSYAGSVFDIELKLKSMLSNYRYNPSIKFAGSRYECFSQITTEAYELIDSLVDCNNERVKV